MKATEPEMHVKLKVDIRNYCENCRADTAVFRFSEDLDKKNRKEWNGEFDKESSFKRFRYNDVLVVIQEESPK